LAFSGTFGPSAQLTSSFQPVPTYGPPAPSLTSAAPVASGVVYGQSVFTPYYGPTAPYTPSPPANPIYTPTTPVYGPQVSSSFGGGLVYGPVSVSNNFAQPTTTFQPVAGSMLSPYGPSVIVSAPTPAPVECVTQNKLDLVKCYGIVSGCFVAQCAANGDFLPKQCAVFPCPAPSTDSCPQCWCVDPETGVEIPLTRVNASQPLACTVPVGNNGLISVPVRVRVPVRHHKGGGGSNVLLCLVRPSLCFGKGGLGP